jgi:hypothetical protein
MPWQQVEAEPPGFVVLYRYAKRRIRSSPSRPTFRRAFSRSQECMCRTHGTNIESDRDQVRKLEIGYSDDVSIFLNGQILYGGRSALSFRDPGFLGIVNTENDAVYLPLKKGNNELLLAVSELGGGWGFICRLTDVAN